MKSYRYLLLPILGLGLFHQVQVAGQSAAIKGYVFDSEKKPAEYSTVVLMNRDSVFMTGALSDSEGLFLFEELSGGSYRVMVRNVEFNTFVSDLITLEDGDLYTMERVQLETRVNDLEEVVIRGEKAMVEVRPDKMVYNVSSSVNATGNNALELLSKSPGVVVDMDKNVIVQGKSGVQIYINGRPSRISGSDLTNMLEGMRSEDIESIEIITNPSAKYDAEGTAGIINIVMKRNPAQGVNGNLTGSYSKGAQPRSSAGASVNYTGEKISVYTTANVSENNYVTDVDEEMLREEFLLDQVSESVYRRRGLNLSGAIDYRINNEHSLGLDVRALLNENREDLQSRTLISDVEGILRPEILIAQNFEDASSGNYNGNLHYSFKPNRASSFTTDISFGTYSNVSFTEQPNDYFVEDSILDRTVDNEFNTTTGINLFSAQADYERSMGKVTLSAGAKYSYIQTENELEFYDIQNGEPALDINRSNDFSYLEKVAAAYVIVNAQPTTQINVNAGLRVENTASLGELVSAIPNPDDVVPRNYTSLFPNVSFSYNDQEKHAISLSVGRRITRPNYQNLNPFEFKTSELSSWQGNPFLKPNYIMNYQVTYSFMRKLVISNTYSVTKNFFANIFETVGEKGNRLITRNMDRAINNGLSVSYPQRVFKWWSFSSFLIYNYSAYSGDVEGTVIDLDAHIVNFRLQNNLQLPLDVTMELSYFGSTPWIWRGTVNVDGYHQVSIGVKRAFFDKRLLLQATAFDPFNTGSIYPYKSNYGGMIIDGNINFDQRRVGFSVTYNFGNQQSKNSRRRSTALDDELERISD